MRNSLSGLFAFRTAAIWIALGILGFAGCDIQKTEPVRTGSLHVLFTVDDTLITGARISLDGRQTTRLTPATLSGLSIGAHRVSVFKPGFVDTALTVDISAVGVDTAQLQSVRVRDGGINLIGAPTGTVLLVNNLPVDTVPVSADNPTLFPAIGTGTFEVSAYLPGYTTELPAKWTVQIQPGTVVPISPVFIAGTVGVDVGDIAPLFSLPSDWDSTYYGIQDYRGHVCLVNFFFYNCIACAEEFPYIAALYNDPQYAGRIQFFGVDFLDSYSRFAQYREDHSAFGITFPLLHDDAQQSVKNAYDVHNCPTSYIVDVTGRIRLIQEGSIPEALLRQTIDDALNTASAPTFDFVMDDTLITYSRRDSSYEFFGVVTNHLNATRSFIHRVTPVAFADTARLTSLCTGINCYLPQQGTYSYNADYQPSDHDIVSLTIYNMVNDSLGGQNTDSIRGDYSVDLTVYPSDNAGERITRRIYLRDGNPGSIIEHPPFIRPTALSFEHPVVR
jgi:peroxiredoxin